jgi:hypothetical protein
MLKTKDSQDRFCRKLQPLDSLFSPWTETVLTTLPVCLFVLVVLGGTERLARDLALRAVPIRIHVNGTRAPSTVTRLIWSALSESGTPAIVKTTGTAARILLLDRREIPAKRCIGRTSCRFGIGSAPCCVLCRF